MKTKSSAKKRIEVRKGKAYTAVTGRHHLLSSKPNRQNRTLRKGKVALHPSKVKGAQAMLGGKITK